MPVPKIQTTAFALAAFLAILGAYIALVLTGNDGDALIQRALLLLSVLGIGGHMELRTRQQNDVIGRIEKQTNGVLDDRIKAGSTAAVEDVLTRLGYIVPPEATPTPHTDLLP